ncbi:MAG: 1-acyl-sn-glycerol-3-phosphate acyltransferase [Candidatus Aminicenantes bacterium]|nr:MAG: 1-acyl-sn-glycerol-3-phosphate acyltransferase [Candidatus Aminicenantes bacterium]
MRTIILLIIYVLITLLLIPVLLLCYVIGNSRPLLWAGKNAMRIGPKILGIRIKVSGIDVIEQNKSYIFMSNHLSFLDGPLLYFVIPLPIRVILKKEIFRIPVIGLGMKQVDFVPVDRKSMRGGKKSIDHAASLMKEKGYSFLIFPEGTRSRNGKLQEFRRGGFFLATASQSAIIPISIQGTYELMPKGRFFVKKGNIKVAFHPPIYVNGYNKDNLPILLKEVRFAIQSGLTEAKKEGVP